MADQAVDKAKTRQLVRHLDMGDRDHHNIVARGQGRQGERGQGQHQDRKNAHVSLP